MRFLRALLNSGVFMIILLAAATLYLVYSDAIKREHGIDVTNESSTVPSVADTSTMLPAQTATPEVSASVAQTESASSQEPMQAEPAFETQPPQQAQSAGYAPMMPTMDMGQQQPYGMMPQFPMPEPAQMPMPEPMMPPMGSMDMPAMMTSPAIPQPTYQPMPEMVPAQPIAVSNLDRARAALFEGNLDVAKAAYQAELANSNDPDLHGELGNVYFAQQNWQAAATEYAAAVEGLSAQNRFLQAQYVLGFLMQINPEMGQQAMTTLRTKMYPQTAQ